MEIAKSDKQIAQKRGELSQAAGEAKTRIVSPEELESLGL
jgi:hypothetical protein